MIIIVEIQKQKNLQIQLQVGVHVQHIQLWIIIRTENNSYLFIIYLSWKFQASAYILREQ